MLKKLSVVALAVMVALGSGSLAYAHEGHESSERPEVLNKVEKKVESTVQTVTKNETETTVDHTKEQVRSQRQQIDDRKQELKQKLEEKSAERKEKLEGRRLAQCQNRQDDINSLLDRSVDNGRERLVRIQRFEEGVKAFYEKQQLVSEAYTAAVLNVDEKEAAAIAALDTIAGEDFACDSVDPAKPAEMIRSTHETKHAALKEYRTSVKELIKIVRAAFEAKQTEVQTDE